MTLLNNRFFRLLVSVISQLILIILLFYLALDKAFSTKVLTFLFASYALGVVGLILFDLLDIGFLNNTVGRIIKLAIFYLAVIALIVITFGVDYRGLGEFVTKFTTPVYEGQPLKTSMGMGKAILTSMASSCIPLVAASVTVFAREDFLEEGRYPLTFAMAIGYIASLIIGLAIGAAYMNGLNFNSLYIVSFVVGLVILVLVTVFFGLPFEYYSDGSWWCLKRVIFRNKKSSSYSSSSSNSYSNNYTPQRSGGTDNRKNGNGALSAKMSSIASSASGSQSLSYYSRVDFRVSSWVGAGTIRFTISGSIHPSSSVKTQAEADVIKNEVRNAAEALSNRLNSEAKSAVAQLRNTYKDYDGSYSIEVRIQ